MHKLVADSCCFAKLKGRIFLWRASKMAVASSIRMGAGGIKISTAGRLGGGWKWPRTEIIQEGKLHYNTF